ncbi:hypothetical protein ACHAXS_002628 [Conticribra weissflogii]
MRDQSQDSTLEAKRSFERHADTFRVSIKGYHADNGLSSERKFQEKVEQCNQQLHLCAVGTHHQNGIVERAIKDLTLITCTLLLHAKRHWPEMISTMLWPMALKAAENRLNHLSLAADGMTPLTKFSGNGRLQTNPKGVPKWEPRSRVGVYMGHSPAHAGSVAMVLNPTTGHISPQFHVVFDDILSMAELVSNSAKLATNEDFDLTKTWFESIDDPGESPLDLLPLPTPISANEGASTEISANKGEEGSPPFYLHQLPREMRWILEFYYALAVS